MNHENFPQRMLSQSAALKRLQRVWISKEEIHMKARQSNTKKIARAGRLTNNSGVAAGSMIKGTDVNSNRAMI
jgi:hypothetical protein